MSGQLAIAEEDATVCEICAEIFDFNDMKNLPEGPYCQDCYDAVYG